MGGPGGREAGRLRSVVEIEIWNGRILIRTRSWWIEEHAANSFAAPALLQVHTFDTLRLST